MPYSYKNSELFSPAMVLVVIVGMVLIMNFGCEPISLPGQPNNYDKPAVINGFVAPDSVSADRVFSIQVNFQVACNNKIVTVRRRNALPQITFTPIVNVDRNQSCNAPPLNYTAIETLRIYDPGLDTLNFSGENYTPQKLIRVLHYPFSSTGFSFHFLFRNAEGKVPNFSSTFQRLDDMVVHSIQADTLGYWDTTFTDPLSKLRYRIGSLEFEATKGVKESGVILVQ